MIRVASARIDTGQGRVRRSSFSHRICGQVARAREARPLRISGAGHDDAAGRARPVPVAKHPSQGLSDKCSREKGRTALFMRDTRYQALIVQDDRVLLIQHKEHTSSREYWLLPGGGLEPGETPEACVAREVNEETHLTVRVERQLFDEAVDPSSGYLRRKTFLCRPLAGQASPGYEPESEASELYSISRVRWLDLRTEANWGSDLVDDPKIYLQLHRARSELGHDE